MSSKYSPHRVLAKTWAVVGKGFSDRIYLQGRFLFLMKQWFHVDNPKTLNEKLNWLKIYYKNPILTNLVDKAEVKELVKPVIGEKYIILTLGVWDNFDDIDFDALPSQFVLKSTNGGGGTGVYVCLDKSNLDKYKVKRQL